MKTAEFLSALNANRGLPLCFSLGGGRHVPAGYHLTEVKRVAFETVDCGAMTHAWKETHFELWASPLPEIRPAFMEAGKFLAIVGRVEATLPLERDTEAKIYFGDRHNLAALYSVERIAVANGRLEVTLEADSTQCKAATRRLKGLVSAATSCCSGAPADSESAGGGCCGSTPAKAGNSGSCCGGEGKPEPEPATVDRVAPSSQPTFGSLGFTIPTLRLAM